MSETVNSQTTENALRKRWLRIAAGAALLILIGFLGYQGWQQWQLRNEMAHKADVQAEAIARIEDEWGVRFVQVAPVAGGGLIDLRYQVTDPDKAIYMFDEVENIPRIIAKNGAVLSMNDDPHTHDLEFGLSYFFLLRNIQNAVESGDEVTLAIGDMELPYFVVK